MNNIERAIQKIKEFGLYHAIQDLPHSKLTVEAFELAISALEKQLNGGWIPVSEMLPNYTSDYNVTVGVGSELGYFEEVRTYRYEIYNGKNPYRKWIIPNRFDEVINIIAWQELPEKYKESE